MTSPLPNQDRAAAPPAYLKAAVAGAFLLVVAGGAAFYYASKAAQAPRQKDLVSVAVTQSACEPASLTVPAGRRTFEIVNRSNRAVEWEILQGVMVVEERENIAPGLRQSVTVQLSPGDYQMTCGLLSNPQGAVHVTPAAGAATASAAPTLRMFLGPLAEYQFYLSRQSGAMVRDVQALADAIKSGDIDKAKALYSPARQAYKRLEPVIYRFSDLVNKMNPAADFLEKRESDPGFTGFHKIEYDLFARNDVTSLQPAADGLLQDATALRERLDNVQLTPQLLVQGAQHLAEQLATGRILSGEDKYAFSDLNDIEANLEGLQKIADLVAPVMAASAPEEAENLKTAFKTASNRLLGLKRDGIYPSYKQISEAQRQDLANDFGTIEKAFQSIDDKLAGGASENGEG